MFSIYNTKQLARSTSTNPSGNSGNPDGYGVSASDQAVINSFLNDSPPGTPGLTGYGFGGQYGQKDYGTPMGLAYQTSLGGSIGQSYMNGPQRSMSPLSMASSTSNSSSSSESGTESVPPSSDPDSLYPAGDSPVFKYSTGIPPLTLVSPQQSYSMSDSTIYNATPDNNNMSLVNTQAQMMMPTVTTKAIPKPFYSAHTPPPLDDQPRKRFRNDGPDYVPEKQASIPTSNSRNTPAPKTEHSARPPIPSATELNYPTNLDSDDELDDDEDDEDGTPGSVSLQSSHTLTHKRFYDKSRRAKIKTSIDSLKKLIPFRGDTKIDQATIVASSVTFVQNLKDEVAQLRKRIDDLEIDLDSSESKSAVQRSPPPLSTLGLSSIMASLNGAGVSMNRISLQGQIIEVNLIYEMVTGYSAKELVGKTPCMEPLHGSLSYIPKAYSSFINGSGIFGLQSTGERQSLLPQPHMLNNALIRGNSSAEISPSVITTLPVVPQHELESFFPMKIHVDASGKSKPMSCHDKHDANNRGYLSTHLERMPENHVLKLLARNHTVWGDVLEAIVTFCLVRDSNGKPDHIISMATPDARRIINLHEVLPKTE